MSTQPIDDETLQRFLDGDLPDAEAAAVGAALESDADLVERAVRLDRLASALRLADADVEASFGDAAASDALFARIEAELATEIPAGRPNLQVVAGGRSKVRRILAGVTGGLAIAAAVTLAVLVPRGSDEPDVATHGRVATPHPRGTEVLDVDFGKSTGTLFTVEGSGGQKVTVVWIVDDTKRSQ